jgi:undecaprenyl-diphosphatase
LRENGFFEALFAEMVRSSVQDSRAASSRLFVPSRILLGVLFLGLFLLVWAIIVYSKAIDSFDEGMEVFINSHQTGALTPLMVVASTYGREYFWIPVVAIMLIFGRQSTKMLAIELAILFVIGIASGEVLKVVLFRAKPFVALPNSITVPSGISLDHDSSFPSGHALIVSIGAAFILWKVFNLKGGGLGKVVALLLALEASLVCYSRLYNGLHYPLDVAAGGIFLGTAITLLGGCVMERYLSLQLQKLEGLGVIIAKALHLPALI